MTESSPSHMQSHQAGKAGASTTVAAGNQLALGGIWVNTLANFFGKSWAALLNLAVIPLYVRWLGVEAFGLFAFYATLQAAFFVFDFGFSTTLNRELARRSGIPNEAGDMRDTVRTLEIIYWLIAATIGATIASLSGFIASHWINAVSLRSQTIHVAVALMGISIALQWPVTFYTSGLFGLERHVLCNALNSAFLAFRYGGAACVLVFADSSILAFFSWQVLANLLHVSGTAFTLWHVLPRDKKPPVFRMAILHRVGRFTTGLTCATLATLAFVQLDKIVLSKWLPLEEFAHYNLAWTLAGSLYLFYHPIATGTFPGFVRKAALGDTRGISLLYHQASQWVAVTVIPLAAVCILFAPELLQLWLRDPVLARHVSPLLSIVTCGALIGAITYVPIIVQWAYGSTRLVLEAHLLGIPILIAALYFAVLHASGVGAATAWVVVRVMISLLLMWRMHQRFLSCQFKKWLRYSVIQPLCVVATITLILRSLVVWPHSLFGGLALLGLLWGALTLVAIATTPMPAQMISHLLRAAHTFFVSKPEFPKRPCSVQPLRSVECSGGSQAHS